jgi:hypothetical protein
MFSYQYDECSLGIEKRAENEDENSEGSTAALSANAVRCIDPLGLEGQCCHVRFTGCCAMVSESNVQKAV